jgi:hypothetical protein
MPSGRLIDFTPMPSLQQVLHEASQRGASEVTLESDQHPMVKTEAGSVTVGDPLSQSELFDALAVVLGPDQQAELALGNIVSFAVEAAGQHWSLVAEPTAESIVVRGRTDGASSPEAETFPSPGRALDLPKLDAVEPDRQTVPATGKSILRPTKRRTQWDVGVLDTPVAPPRAPTPPPSKPSWSRQLADGGDTSDFEIRTPTGEQPANLVDAHDLVDPAARPTAEPARAPSGEVEVRSSLEAFASSVAAGTLCLVQGLGQAQVLANALAGGDYALIDDPDPNGVMRAAAELESGGRFAVCLEDPSVALGWILRRLEEGARVVVESRARTAPGARRILLGLAASDRAEGWLAVHPLVWFTEDATGWSRHEF